jgi:hypothetical protein
MNKLILTLLLLLPIHRVGLFALFTGGVYLLDEPSVNNISRTAIIGTGVAGVVYFYTMDMEGLLMDNLGVFLGVSIPFTIQSL